MPTTKLENTAHIRKKRNVHPRVIVVQTGARHNYAIPRMLEHAGMLRALYTDSCVHGGMGAIASRLPAVLHTKRLIRLTQRRARGVPATKINVTDQPLWSDILRSLKRTTPFERYSAQDAAVSRACMRWGHDGTDVIYSMFGEGSQFLEGAREAGVRVAVDMFISPIAHRILNEEAYQHPGWAEPADLSSPEETERYERRVAEILRLTDVLTCPSQFVINGCQAYEAFDESKARLVPYSAGFDFGGRVNDPVSGRVLFVGRACMRKGIHHLAFAADRLCKRKRPYEYRIAGSVAEPVLSRPESRHLEFLGWLLRQQLREEFLHADVMAFPSLAEGSASVIYEAMAAGLPVITTHSAGSIITHDYDGIIVPERDPDALATAIEEVVEDREKRNRLAVAALDTARRQGEDIWRDRLVDVLSSFSVRCQEES